MIVDLNLDSKTVLVIGGGTEGMRKVHGLLGQGCDITVIDTRINKELLQLGQQDKIKIIQQTVTDISFMDGFKNIFLVLAATDDKDLNRKILDKGRAMGAFVYAADDPAVSDFSYASLTNIEGVLQVAISTYGKSPIMARKIRMRIERILHRIIKTSDLDNILLQDFARSLAKQRIKSIKERKQFLYSLLKNRDIQNLILSRKLEEAKKITRRLIKNWQEIHK
jgi:precorrin-2 dehydrogenase / sirohydrochlorin ferrochelatase